MSTQDDAEPPPPEDVRGILADKEGYTPRELMSTAENAAREAQEMGYDPVAAVEALPELLQALSDAKEFICKQYDQVHAVPPQDSLAYVRAKNALASAEGGDD